MTETGPSPTRVHHDLKRKRRRCLFPCVICSVVVLALVLTAVILAVTVFRPRDPTTTLISANVTGISPRIDITNPLNLQINVTLDLVIRVRNPNYASFSHRPGKAQLYYRGAQVGEADVAEGKIEARRSTDVNARLVVDGSSVTGQLTNLAGDVISGGIRFDTKTRLEGKVLILGFIRRKAVATSECHMVVGVTEMKVTSQQCTDKTKL